MALQADSIPDLLVGTQKDLGPMKWTDLSTDTQEFYALPRLLKKKKVQFDSGYGIQRNIMIDHSNAAHHTGLFAEDAVNVGDVMMTITVPWRHTTTNYAYERREIAMNRSPAKLVDLVKIRRTDAMIALAELIETAFWGKPVNSSDDTTPYGLQYWCVPNASTGFTGENPDGFSDVAGKDSSADAYARWRNYSYRYTNVSKADLVKGWRTAWRKCGFKSPVPHPDYKRGSDNWEFFTNEATLSNLEDLAEQQNDRLGVSMSPMDDRVVMRGRPIYYVPHLDDESTNPIFGVNWATFYPVFLKGEYLHEERPEKVSGQHTVYAVHVDLSWNLLNTNRRGLMVLAKA